MRSQETPGRAHAAWTTKWFVETLRKIVNTLRRTTPLVSLEREESAKEEQKNPGQTNVNLMSDLENNATNQNLGEESVHRATARSYQTNQG